MEAESPPLPGGKITEIAAVAQAFSTVQRTAVEAAVGQANLRKGVNQVFLNLSLRNQSLLHRQLGMLDSMERATNEPSALADLFRLDHLTTRMRRHAEGLIILSGATPGRGWRDPVPVVDVLRAAIAEVEDYVRVNVASESRDAVVGAAVNDVIHLVAELVENATTFSPPHDPGGDPGRRGRQRLRGGDRGPRARPRPPRNWPTSMRAWPARPSSTWPTATSSACSWWASSPCGTGSGSRCASRRTAGPRPSCLMPHSIIVREGETRSRAAAGGTGQPALVPVPGNGGPGPLLPADATGPITYRERASSFSLTGRHRLEPVGARRRFRAGPGQRDSTRGAGTARGRARLRPGTPPAGYAGPGSPAHPARPAEPAGPAAPGPDLARRHPSEATGTHRGLPGGSARPASRPSSATTPRPGGPPAARPPPRPGPAPPRRPRTCCPRSSRAGCGAGWMTWTTPTTASMTGPGAAQAARIPTTVRVCDGGGKHGRATELAAGQPGRAGRACPPGGHPVPGRARRGHLAEHEPRGR